MADDMNKDIDEIIGEEDLDLDLDNDSGVSDDIQDVSASDDTQNDEDAKKAEDPEKSDDTPTDNLEDAQPPVSDDDKKEDQPEEVAPTPLTKEDILSAINDARSEERNSAKEIEEATNDILKQYYPDGLSNVLVDGETGKKLQTPQDVVDASGGEMSIEEATKWLMNEQYKLDQNIARIKDDARNLAETNANFRSGVNRVLEKYKDVFEKFPQQQEKIYKAYMKQVKLDNEKDLVLAAPDVEEFYDLFMEPYVLAYGNMKAQEQAQGQASGVSQAPASPQADSPQIPDAKPSINDRLDESGDVGVGGNDDADPNDPDSSLNKLFGE